MEGTRAGVDELRMWVAVRTDLGISLGKMVAQACHCMCNLFADVMLADPELMRAYVRGREAGRPVSFGQAKIALRARNEHMLRRALAEARAAGIPCLEVEDEGRTEIPAGTLTAIAFGPAREGDLPGYLKGLRKLSNDDLVKRTPEHPGTGRFGAPPC